jgi:hypothetical protein
MDCMLGKIAPVLLTIAVVAPVPTFAADRAHVATTCKPAEDKFTYDCTFKLTNARTGAPLANAEVVIGADMPSMPMAHNVKPVAARPANTVGEYTARLTLEMHGDWALRLRISGPVRDQIVELRNFDARGAGPPSKRSGGTPRDSSHHKH